MASLKIWDTAGQEEYSALAETHYSRANGFIIVYSVVSRSGFASVDKFRERILSNFELAHFPMVIAANKIDLVGERVVSQQEGRDLAKSFDVPYVECSAKTNTNIEECFAALVRLMRHPRHRKEVLPTDNPDFFKHKKCVIC